jgi:DNA-binding MarR family transcriptional regulator
VTTAVDRLEARRLVARTFDPTDRRARIVTLTPEGKTTIGAIFGRHKKAMDRLGEALTTSERATLIGLIKKLGLAAEQRLNEARSTEGGQS